MPESNRSRGRSHGNLGHGYQAVSVLGTLLSLLVLACFSLWGGPGPVLSGDSVGGDKMVVPLPDGMSPTAVFTTNSPSLVIKAARDADYRVLYSWEPGGVPKLIIRGRDLDITRLSEDEFAAWYSEDGLQEIVTLDGQDLVSQPLKLPNGGPSGWGICEGNHHTVVCTGNRPGMKAEDKDYDEMAFSAVLVVDLAKRTTTWFPVGHQTRLRFDPQHSRIYATDWTDPSSRKSVGAFDLVGRMMGTARLSDVMPSSPSGRYLRSLQEDGSESWDVYNGTSMRLLLAFNCDQQGCREGDWDDNQWNPKFTDEVVALREGGAYGKGGECDVYKLSPPRLMKTVPCGGLPVYDWSRDGRDLIIIQYEGNIYHRLHVN